MSVETEKIPAQSELVAIADLKPHPRNYKSHPEDQLAHIKESLRIHGQYRNVAVSSDGYILAGHGVVLAATELGWTELEVKLLPVEHDSPIAIQLLIGDNEMAQLAHVDDRELTELLRAIRDLESDDLSLLGTGFNDEVLANLIMVTRPANEIANFDAAKEWLGMPEHDEEPEKAIEIIVRFRNQEDREEFCKLHDADPRDYKSGKGQMWWPHKPQNDLKSVKFVEEDEEADPAQEKSV